ncbi:hypothetical protein MAP00_007995 [Monascus purpureus]|nr:hypothetical protein MAP00_007995 [Monascus purpureus]
MDTRDLAGDESDSSEDEASSAQEFERTAAERNAFLFGHNLALPASDVREFHPLPSQIPFLLDVFSENVNFFLRCVHMPTVSKMVRDLRHSGMRHLTPSNEALLFSIYYAAIVSMEEDDVMTNFGSPKTDLSLRYRCGLEHALAKADFLNFPDMVLVQALAIFLCLTRRHSSPRFVWMMTGLAIRMAQYLGLQRDGAHFKHLTPFEIETRRNIWWILCMLDVRTSEDQGTDLTITSGSFDTKIPLNVNDADIDPESKKMPTERRGVTDMSFARISAKITDIMRQMMTPGVRDGVAGLEDQSRLLNKIYQNFEQEYFQHTTESGNIAYWVAVTLAKLVMAKMTLIVFLPVLFSPPSEEFSDEIRTKLLLSAIEVAEYNHALNAEPICRQWRWLYQTCTHWHAIVYLLIEISRRPWSTIVERAWIALHSRWLIPAPSPIDKNLRIWVPLRRLMHQARKHRDAELSRLRADPQAATTLDMEDQKIPLPSSSGLFQTGSSGDIFRARWHQLMIIPERPKENTKTSKIADTELLDQQIHTVFTGQSTLSCGSTYRPDDLSSNMHPGANRQQAGQTIEGTCELSLDQSFGSWPSMVLVDGADGATMEPGSVPLLWNDAENSIGVFPDLDLGSIDVNMDLDGEVNWYDWIESAKGID